MHKILPLIFSLLVTMLHAQNPATTNTKISTTVAKRIGKTKPLSELVQVPGLPPEKKAILEKRKQTVKNFQGKTPAQDFNTAALPKGTDPVRQSEIWKNNSSSVEPLLNIEGFHQGNSTNSNPPDPCGDIGQDYYIQMVNTTVFKILDKTGNIVVDAITANTLWQEMGFSSAGDPIILYDQEYRRWYITEFTSSGYLLVAVSETEDPTGSWHVYNFATPNFPDYPKYALWPNALFLTTNEPGSSPAYFLDRMALINGEETVAIQRLEIPAVPGGPGFQVATPVDWTGSILPPLTANPILLRLHDDNWGDVPEDRIEIFEIDIDFTNPENTIVQSFFMPTAPFDTRPCAAPGSGLTCIPQLDGNGIDGVPEVIMHQVHYRNFCTYEAIVLCFIVDATAGENVSGIRWMELRRTPESNWAVFQEGTFAPDDGKHRFVPSIAMDIDGNIALGYCVSGEDIYPGLAYTGRRATDPTGIMTLEEFNITEGFSPSPSIRYGDYSQMTIDPVNEKTFWFTGEYRRAENWGTKIVSFEFQDSVDLAPVRLLTPESMSSLSANEPVSVEIRNAGLTTQTAFAIGFVFQNEPEVIENITVNLQPGEMYTHTFATTVDMATIGAYNFKIFTLLENDGILTNDTLCLKRNNLPRLDVATTNIFGFDGISCADEGTISIAIENKGTELLTSANIVVTLNDEPLETIVWEGNLPPNQSAVLPVFINNLQNGNNTITVEASGPNGQVDEWPQNNLLLRNFEVLTEGVDLIFTLMMDNYPYETTWVLESDAGETLSSGGPYQENNASFTKTFCLHKDSCYTFIIFDSFGDGTEDYSLELMETIIAEGGSFGAADSTTFCPNDFCLLTADIAITNESANGAADASMMITPQNAAGNIQYSIDGGTTFQESNIFNDLSAGIYPIVVQAGEPTANCIYQDTINIIITNTTLLADKTHIELLPNPTNGLFRINLAGLKQSDPFLKLNIFDATGKLVYPGNLVRYDNTFTGQFSLVAYPPGVYYIRFSNPKIKQLLKVIKY